VASIQVVDPDGNSIAATRTSHAFGVASGQKIGLLNVPYQVQAAEGAIA
jgi:hypothetical protein